MRPKHTPGPWANDGRETSGCYRVSDASKYWAIAHVENAADAALISAAPELLAFVQGILEEQLGLGEGGDAMYITQARKLIAKATGGSK